VSSGHTAVAHAAAFAYDAILLDRRLPDADGVDVCRWLRERIAGALPIIMLTADRIPELDVAAGAAGTTAFVSKPFEPATLLQTLATVLPQSSSGPLNG